MLGLHCCMGFFFSCGKWVYSLAVVCGLLIAVVSLSAEHGLQDAWASVAVAHGLR